MNLDNFEQFIEKKILDRGFDYYQSEYIEEVEMIDKMEYSATILGSDEYQVFVKLDEKDNILEHSCDCPYDWGDVCKHEVAVFYHLKNTVFDIDDYKQGSFQMLKKNLAKLSKNDLIALMIDLSKKNKMLRLVLEEEFE